MPSGQVTAATGFSVPSQRSHFATSIATSIEAKEMINQHKKIKETLNKLFDVNIKIFKNRNKVTLGNRKAAELA